MNNKRENYPIGQDLKILVTVTELGEGVQLEDIAYTLKFTSGSKSVSFAATVSGSVQTLASGLRKKDADSVIVALPTTNLDRGDLHLEISADIPDADFTGGVRHEVREIDQNITLY